METTKDTAVLHDHVLISNKISGNVVEVPEEKITPEIVGLIIKGQIVCSIAGFIAGIIMIVRGSFMAEHHVAGELAYKIKIAFFEVESASLGVLLMAIGVLVLILSYYWVRVTPAVHKDLPASPPKS